RIASEDVVMGSHKVASSRLSAGKISQHAREPVASQLRSPRRRTLRDWPVFWRLVAVIVLALQDERDETTGVSSGGNRGALQPWYRKTDAAAARVRGLAAGVGGSFPA